MEPREKIEGQEKYYKKIFIYKSSKHKNKFYFSIKYCPRTINVNDSKKNTIGMEHCWNLVLAK
jgi:hypothetical protein